MLDNYGGVRALTGVRFIAFWTPHPAHSDFFDALVSVRDAGLILQMSWNSPRRFLRITFKCPVILSDELVESVYFRY